MAFSLGSGPSCDRSLVFILLGLAGVGFLTGGDFPRWIVWEFVFDRARLWPDRVLDRVLLGVGSVDRSHITMYVRP